MARSPRSKIPLQSACARRSHGEVKRQNYTTVRHGVCEPQSQWCTSIHTWQMVWEQGVTAKQLQPCVPLHRLELVLLLILRYRMEAIEKLADIWPCCDLYHVWTHWVDQLFTTKSTEILQTFKHSFTWFMVHIASACSLKNIQELAQNGPSFKAVSLWYSIILKRLQHHNTDLCFQELRKRGDLTNNASFSYIFYFAN